MALKDLWTKSSGWFKKHSIPEVFHQKPSLDNEGLIDSDSGFHNESEQQNPSQNHEVAIKTVQPSDKSQSLEKLQAGFDNLITQLQSINNNLDQHITQQQNLTDRMEKLPELLESFPTVVENQKELTGQLLEQLKAMAAKNQQFIEAVEKIPNETAKQTDALVEIDHQLAASADADVQMVEGFNKFNEALDGLNKNTRSQTDSIMQMSKTFATSDRYLKYLVSRQNKRFMWIFFIAVSVCVAVILALTGIIIYIKQ